MLGHSDVKNESDSNIPADWNIPTSLRPGTGAPLKMRWRSATLGSVDLLTYLTDLTHLTILPFPILYMETGGRLSYVNT